MADSSNDRQFTTWIPFTGTLLLFLGTFNMIDGFAALSKDDFFNDSELLIGSLETWGWIWLVLGALQILTSYFVFNQKTAGMVMAVAWAFFGSMAHLMAVGAYPIYSLTMIVISFMVMFGLLTHSDEFS